MTRNQQHNELAYKLHAVTRVVNGLHDMRRDLGRQCPPVTDAVQQALAEVYRVRDDIRNKINMLNNLSAMEARD